MLIDKRRIPTSQNRFRVLFNGEATLLTQQVTTIEPSWSSTDGHTVTATFRDDIEGATAQHIYGAVAEGFGSITLDVLDGDGNGTRRLEFITATVRSHKHGFNYDTASGVEHHVVFHAEEFGLYLPKGADEV